MLQMRKLRTILVVFIVVCVVCAICLGVTCDSRAAEKEKIMAGAGNSPFSLTLDADIAYGPISGFTQAGLGGRPGTGSPNRPKIKDDLGVDDVTMTNFSIEPSWKRHSLYTSAHLINLEGENILDRRLIFHGRTYTAGMRIKSEIKSNWYEIGYRFRLGPSSRGSFTIAPTVAVAFWDFGIQLQESGIKNERSYSSVTPRLGALFEWNPSLTPRLSFTGKAIGSLPIKEMLHIYTLGLTANYNLVSTNRFKLGFKIGVGYEHIDSKDGQTFPNKVRIDIGPMTMGGLEMKF
jgi:hypothetical protein